MAKSSKTILFIAGGLFALLVLAAVALLFFVDADAYKPRLEAVASKALGMEVSVEGRLGVNFFPGLLVTLKDVHVRNRGTEVASAAEARLGLELLPLFRKQVRMGSISLQHARISIERSRDGTFNFEQPEAARGNLPALDLAIVSLADGTLRYLDQSSGEGFEVGECSLVVRHLQRPRENSPDPGKNLSFSADLACGELRKDDFTVSDLKVAADRKNGVVDFQPVTMQLFGASGSGNVHADFSGDLPHYSVHYSLPQFPVAEFFKILLPQKVAEGRMDFSANLSMQGKTLNQLRQTLEGQILLRGKNLRLNGRDLDQELAQFESSQHFNLVDVGAFFFAGPLGLVVTKGYNFASIFEESGGSSEIRVLVSDWKVKSGIAQAQDVALATKEHRLALQGKLDFVHQQFDNVTVALIDAEGCTKVRQSIQGSFRTPEVQPPSVLNSLTGPVRKLLQMGRDLFPGGECEVFYAGSVTPPK